METGEKGKKEKARQELERVVLLADSKRQLAQPLAVCQGAEPEGNSPMEMALQVVWKALCLALQELQSADAELERAAKEAALKPAGGNGGADR